MTLYIQKCDFFIKLKNGSAKIFFKTFGCHLKNSS